jgi:hypothetical protein
MVAHNGIVEVTKVNLVNVWCLHNLGLAMCFIYVGICYCLNEIHACQGCFYMWLHCNN